MSEDVFGDDWSWGRKDSVDDFKPMPKEERRLHAEIEEFEKKRTTTREEPRG